MNFDYNRSHTDTTKLSLMKISQNLPLVNQNSKELLTNPAQSKGFSPSSCKFSTAKQFRVFGGSKSLEGMMNWIGAAKAKDGGMTVKVSQAILARELGITREWANKLLIKAEKDGLLLSKTEATRLINGRIITPIKTYCLTKKALDIFRKSYDHKISSYQKEKIHSNNINRKNNTIQKASLVILDPKKELEEFILTDEIIKKVQSYFNLSLANIKNQFARFKKIYHIVNQYKDMTFHFMQFIHVSIGQGWAKTKDYWRDNYFGQVVDTFDFSWDEKQKLISDGIMHIDTEVAKVKDFIRNKGLKYTASKIKDAVLGILHNKNWKGMERYVETIHDVYINKGIIDKWLEDREANKPIQIAPEISQEKKDEVRRISDEIEARRLAKLRNEDEERKKSLQQLRELEASHPIYPGFFG